MRYTTLLKYLHYPVYTRGDVRVVSLHRVRMDGPRMRTTVKADKQAHYTRNMHFLTMPSCNYAYDVVFWGELHFSPISLRAGRDKPVTNQNSSLCHLPQVSQLDWAGVAGSRRSSRQHPVSHAELLPGRLQDFLPSTSSPRAVLSIYEPNLRGTILTTLRGCSALNEINPGDRLDP